MERVVLVTGAGSGIGRAVSRRLATDGARVACLDIDGDAATATAQSLPAGLALQVDVTDAASVGRAVERIGTAWGDVDLLVCAAGVGSFARTHEVSPEAWARTVAVNLHGTFHACRAALPALLRSSGAIVTIASIAGMSGRAYGAAYAASKAGVIALTRSIALEYGPRGVRANCVCPGAVDTPLARSFTLPDGHDEQSLPRGNRLGRMASPDEVAGAVAYLASADAAYVTGSSLVIDGGTSA